MKQYMKHKIPMEMFLSKNPAWLEQFDHHLLLAELLAMFEASAVAVYMIDLDQKVLYWSKGLEDLTGLAQADLISKICIPECAITDTEGHSEQPITLILEGGSRIELMKMTKPLVDKNGIFAGAIGLLSRPSQLHTIDYIPKILKSPKQNFHGILSRSPAMQDVFQIIQNAAETEATVLVRGESGSGKELVANAIHTLSARSKKPFLAVNCAALSSNLLESELFGHVKGAFTGAIKDRSGLFERANGGTLFLDEIGEIPLELQAKLLRVLQERNYIPVGGNKIINTNVRIVAATHRSLREEVKNGRFREDLMYRLRVVPIFLPPLRDRREDISLLIWHFISLHNNQRLRIIKEIEPDAMRVLLDYAWPGNIRELHNVVEYSFAVGRGAILRLSELPPEFRESDATATRKNLNLSKLILFEDERTAISQALEHSQGRLDEAARLLGMSRVTFWRKRKLHGV